MNIPEIYLVEPYNAYAPKGKKKHWMQEVEEQNLLARIIAEQQQLREDTYRNATLAPNMPPSSQPTVAGTPQPGGGGAPRPQYFNPESGSFGISATPVTGSAPTTVAVGVTGGSNTLALGGANVTWNWGDGTTGGGAGATHTYTGTGSFNITLGVSASINNAIIGYAVQQVTMSVPTVTAAFTLTGSTTTIGAGGYYTASHTDTLTFINNSTTNNPSNVLTYNWTFGEGHSSSLAGPTFSYSTAGAGTYTVNLGVSGSFNARSSGARNILIV